MLLFIVCMSLRMHTFCLLNRLVGFEAMLTRHALRGYDKTNAMTVLSSQEIRCAERGRSNRNIDVMRHSIQLAQS